MDFDWSAQSGINPGIAGAAAGKDKGMNRPAAIDDGQPHIAVGRDVRERMDLMPHAAARAREAGIRFDPAQIRGYCRVCDMETQEHMERLIRRENVKHFRELLKTAKEEAARQRIQKLLAQELQKQKDAGDKVEE